ncbi:hypothetical protein B9Z55_004090 [Caenorhabditis nigoni]|uniref:Uncharacterized protein n=1 Tax=Caenorhabditis nigoni TaxID=1611254 RepID=A0A2G5UUS3_9PELO|nr:hypothetical protein B9Z55_004090 [Caenorhabditis nigoni]
MYAQVTPFDIATAKRRVLESLRSFDGHPSLSLDSFVAVAPHVLVMKFPAREFLFSPSPGVLNVVKYILEVTSYDVALASWEMLREEKEEWTIVSTDPRLFQEPKIHEEIKIVGQAIPTHLGSLLLTSLVTVEREGIDVTIMECEFHIRRPAHPQFPPRFNARRLVADEPQAPIPNGDHSPLGAIIPIHEDAPGPAPPVQQPRGSQAAPRPSKTQLRRERRERVLLRIAREKEEREKDVMAAAAGVPEYKPPAQP